MTPGPADEARRALREALQRQRRAAGGEAEPPAVEQSAVGQPAVKQPSAEQPSAGGAGAGDPAAGDATATDKSAATEKSAATDSAATEESAGTEEAPASLRRDESRPADGARAALREAVAARRGRGEDTDDAGRAGTSENSRPADSVQSDADFSNGETQPPSARPQGDDESPSTSEGAEKNPSATDPAAVRPATVAREALRAARSEARRVETEAGRSGGRPAWGPRRAERAGDGRGAGTVRRSGDGGGGATARNVKELLAGAFRMPSPDEADGPGHDDVRAAQGSGAIRPTPPASPLPSDPSHTTDSSRPRPSDTPAPPQHAPSMAAPARDGELRRTFPALPAPPPVPAASGASDPSAGPRFAATWWGNAWVTALEEGALDAKRLARGRSYAEQGHVDAITVTPGLVLAYVQGSRPRPYRVQVRLRTLDDADWARFLDAAVERPGHIAALLDKELPQSLADCGVPLLPGPRDLDPHCSCPDRGHPCKHAAALCYQTARLLDADPFVLLLLRGRGERELLDALSRLNAARAARAAQDQEPAPLPGVRATEALAQRRLPPLPQPLPVPPHPEQPPVYPAAPGGPDPFALDQLATDAAARAHALLTSGRDPVAELTLWQDAVRLAAARPGSGLTGATRALYASLASATGRTAADLARAVAAWRQGGLEGLAVLEEPWDPPAGRFDRARPLLLAADLPAFRPWRNHLTHPRGHVQLRLGRDGLWYAYESEPGRDDWWPRGTPDLDPVGALTGLGTPGDP
ncbi:SWIM zinc finger family protein [Streptomyces sp. NPDC006668]|uniref:SWIM zinc finger family protein n=1 Tax=Streptomyces sp. NPDC006668 TaxID=3156903 RepID=UPI0033E7C9B4